MEVEGLLTESGGPAIRQEVGGVHQNGEDGQGAPKNGPGASGRAGWRSAVRSRGRGEKERERERGGGEGGAGQPRTPAQRLTAQNETLWFIFLGCPCRFEM